jgi:hypothetical protein
MMWLTWRQFHVHAIAVAAVLAVLATQPGATDLHLADLYNASGIPSCRASSDCGTLVADFIDKLKAGGVYNLLFFAGIGVLFVAPALFGVFWRAPLVTREIDAGTFRLAWNQSITKARWQTPPSRLTRHQSAPPRESGVTAQRSRRRSLPRLPGRVRRVVQRECAGRLTVGEPRACPLCTRWEVTGAANATA